MSNEIIKESIIEDTKKFAEEILDPLKAISDSCVFVFDKEDYERFELLTINVMVMFVDLEEARYDKCGVGNIADIIGNYLCDYYKVDKEEVYHE